MSIYLDAVLDNNMNPVYNDIPDNVRKWLQNQTNMENHIVVVGRTLKILSITEYLNQK